MSGAQPLAGAAHNPVVLTVSRAAQTEGESVEVRITDDPPKEG